MDGKTPAEGRQRKLFIRFVFYSALVALGAVAVLFIVNHFSGDVAVTPLPASDQSIQVGPLELGKESKLVITTPDFHAALDSGGAGIFTEKSSSLPEDAPVAERRVALPANVYAKILADLGAVKARWAARKVGEDAAAENAAVVGEAPPIDLSVEEHQADGSIRVLIRVSKNEPEYAELTEMLTPIRLTK